MSIYSVSYPLLNIQSKMMLWFLVLPFDILFLIPWIILDLQRYGEISKILVFNFKHSKGRSVVISLEVLGNYKIFNFIFIQYVQTKFLLNSKTIVTYNCLLLSKTIAILIPCNSENVTRYCYTFQMKFNFMVKKVFYRN